MLARDRARERDRRADGANGTRRKRSRITEDDNGRARTEMRRAERETRERIEALLPAKLSGAPPATGESKDSGDDTVAQQKL